MLCNVWSFYHITLNVKTLYIYQIYYRCMAMRTFITITLTVPLLYLNNMIYIWIWYTILIKKNYTCNGKETNLHNLKYF